MDRDGLTVKGEMGWVGVGEFQERGGNIGVAESGSARDVRMGLTKEGQTNLRAHVWLCDSLSDSRAPVQN